MKYHKDADGSEFWDYVTYIQTKSEENCPKYDDNNNIPVRKFNVVFTFELVSEGEGSYEDSAVFACVRFKGVFS